VFVCVCVSFFFVFLGFCGCICGVFLVKHSVYAYIYFERNDFLIFLSD